jgi:hypothetical protein
MRQCPQSSQASTWPPSAAVRQFSIADMSVGRSTTPRKLAAAHGRVHAVVAVAGMRRYSAARTSNWPCVRSERDGQSIPPGILGRSRDFVNARSGSAIYQRLRIRIIPVSAPFTGTRPHFFSLRFALLPSRTNCIFVRIRWHATEPGSFRRSPGGAADVIAVQHDTSLPPWVLEKVARLFGMGGLASEYAAAQ